MQLEKNRFEKMPFLLLANFVDLTIPQFTVISFHTILIFLGKILVFYFNFFFTIFGVFLIAVVVLVYNVAVLITTEV